MIGEGGRLRVIFIANILHSLIYILRMFEAVLQHNVNLSLSNFYGYIRMHRAIYFEFV